ncbi:carboxypeptidase-like regulatory domain-containing protein [Wenyingzhuangia sp. 1_MG-2023]|nr:carboxypeptidase-like regulatory domain-containing protein [Wenyingzhuangia sp. 1_MG-2023]
MKKFYITFIICILSISFGFSQDLMKFTLKGKISNAIDSTAIEGTTLLNITKVDGTISNKNGLFEIDLQESDTLLISHIGFESIKLKITRDLSKGTELNIELHPKIENLEEVRIHKLIGVLEIDIKNVPKDKYNRIHINGLPQTYEIRKNNNSVSGLSVGQALTNPVDFVYNLFGKKPKKLRDLKELKEKDATREILTNRFDREIILDYLQMDITELTETLSECNYSAYFISKATDLQLIEAVLECYENHKAVREGNTSKQETKK